MIAKRLNMKRNIRLNISMGFKDESNIECKSVIITFNSLVGTIQRFICVN